MSQPVKNLFVLVTGLTEDIDRSVLKKEFSNFGYVTKLYLEQNGAYAKVYYKDIESCERSAYGLKNNPFGWNVIFNQNQEKLGHVKENLGISIPASANNNRKMAGYDDYLEDEFTTISGYCTIHGKALDVLQGDSGDLFVNIKDVKDAGFQLFRTENFNHLLVDRRQITKEFELHLLSEAKNYILKNRVASIDEEQILRTIERCKNKLLGDRPPEEKSPIAAGRSIVQSPKGNNITITSTTSKQLASSFTSTPVTSPRPPKMFPNNGMSNNIHRTPSHNQTTSQQRPRPNTTRDNKDSNGFINEQLQNGDLAKQKKWQGSANSVSLDSSKTFDRDDNSLPLKKNQHRPKKTNDDAFKDEIGKVVLELGATYSGKISFVEKENICWIQEEKSSSDLEDMLIRLFEAEPDLHTVKNPEVGQLVISLFEGVWCRARIFSSDGLCAHYLDYGNKSRLDSVKILPSEFRNIPELAIRLVINRNKLELVDGMDLKFIIKQQYQDGTYLVDLVDQTGDKSRGGRVTEEKAVLIPPVKEKTTQVQLKDAKLEPSKEQTANTPSDKSYFNVPKPLTDLKDGDKIMVVDIVGDKLAVKTKECVLKSKELNEYIKSLDKSALILKEVKEGQLALCSKDGMVGLYRASVIKAEDNVVTVRYIDYPGEDTLSSRSVRNVDDFLASQPAAMLLSPRYEALDKMEPKGLEFVSELVETKGKVAVVLSDNNFDVKLDDGTLLSQKLRKPELPELPKLVSVKESSPLIHNETIAPPDAEVLPKAKAESSETNEPATDSVVLYDDMDYIKVENGTYDFLCYSLKKLNDITLILLRDDVIAYLEQITVIDVTDTEPYSPDIFEMCLTSYKGPDDEEALWYRGAVFQKDNDSYCLSLVDFGNEITAQSKDIRRFPENLTKIPILGVCCECIGIPDKPEILDRMKELLPESEQVQVTIKSFNDIKYQIEIPAIYEKLKKEGLY